MKTIYFLLLPILFSINTYIANAQINAEALTAALQLHYQDTDLPGFAVAIVSPDSILYQRGFGFADKKQKMPFTPKTVMNIGSVTKTIVGVALVKAIEEGYLSMDSEINPFLPFPIIHPHHKNTPILVKHLATHTSGILDTKHYGRSYIADGEDKREDIFQDYYQFLKKHEPMDLGTFLKNILYQKGKWYKKKNFLKAKPGTVKEYSNLNAALMAYIIEQATKITFTEYVHSRILQPLNMKASGWSGQEYKPSDLATLYFPNGQIVPKYRLITYPDGGLYSNVNDLSHYLIEIIKAYNKQSDYLKTPYTNLLLPGDKDNNRAFWGMGLKSRNIGHGGSDPGVQTDLQFNADSKIGRVIFTNVNAEDNDELWQQYRKIHEIVQKYEREVIH